MKVFVNAKFLSQPITGVQRFAVEISKNLKILCPNIIFLSPRNIIHTEIADELDARIIGSHTGIIWEQYDLPKYLNSLKSPLLLNLANVAPLFYTNQVVTIHDLGFFINPYWYSFTFRNYYKFLIPLIGNRSKRILTVSRSSKGDIVKHLKVSSSKIEVISNAVNLNFSLKEDRVNENHKKYFLAVSSLDPRKNFLRLIKAFNSLESKSIDLLIVGTHNKIFSNQELKDLINENVNIKFLGYVSDQRLVDLYQGALAFIYPSLYEGFGIPPLEAMACGCPTIISDIPVMREVFEDASYYINPYSIDDLLHALNRIQKDQTLRLFLQAQGLKQVQKYSWIKSSQNVAKLLNSMENNPPWK